MKATIFRSMAPGIVFARCRVETREVFDWYVTRDRDLTREHLLETGGCDAMLSQGKIFFVVPEGWVRGEDDFSPGEHVLAHVNFEWMTLDERVGLATSFTTTAGDA